MRAPGRGRVRGAALGLAVALVLGGCAGLPGSGPVVRADDVAPGVEVVTYEPAPPAEGASPEQIAEGFLDAMLAYPVSTAVASEYLTPDAADDWTSSDGVRVYRSPEVTVQQVGDASAQVALQAEESGGLDATGRYRPPVGSLDLTLELEQVDGEWRVATPPSGMLITQSYFETYYEPYDVFFFNLRGEQLLADPVHVPVGDQLATALMASLAAGPPAGLAGEARTYLPPLDQWRPAVTLGPDGVAEIDFDIDVSSLDLEVRRRLSAQVVRTLAQVPGVDSVRIVGTEGPLVVGDTPVQPTTAWRRFDAPAPEGRPGAIVDGRVVTLIEDEVAAVPDLPEDLAADAVLVAVAQGSAAVVTSTGLLRMVLDDGTEVRDTVSSVVGLAWDSAGQLWVADAPDGALRVRILTAAGTTTVETSAVGAGVVSFALDASGRQYAVVGTDGQVRVGDIDRGPVDEGVVEGGAAVPALRPASRVAPDVPGPRTVVWSGPTEVAVLGFDETGGQVYRARADGSPSDGDAGTRPVLPNLVIDGLAVGPGTAPAIYVTDDRRRLWYLPRGGAWRALDVTASGLSSGR